MDDNPGGMLALSVFMELGCLISVVTMSMAGFWVLAGLSVFGSVFGAFFTAVWWDAWRNG